MKEICGLNALSTLCKYSGRIIDNTQCTANQGQVHTYRT